VKKLRTNAIRVGSISLATALVVGLAVSPANASQPATVTDGDLNSHFDSAQRSLGLTTADSVRFDPGVAVSHTRNSAAVSFGETTVHVSAENGPSDTTALANGVRIMSIVNEGERQAEFDIELPENVSLVRAGEGYRIVGQAGDTSVTLGNIEAPWAVDARGKSLSTSYTLRGRTLIQNVDTDGAQFPVVADPTITFGLAGATDGPGAYWNMTGLQAKALSAAVVTVGALTVAGGCTAAGKIPRVGSAIQGLCGFLGVPTLQSVFSAIANIASNTAFIDSACYQIKVAPPGRAFLRTDSSNCA
jgi:hypothetical protein